MDKEFKVIEVKMVVSKNLVSQLSTATLQSQTYAIKYSTTGWEAKKK